MTNQYDGPQTDGRILQTNSGIALQAITRSSSAELPPQVRKFGNSTTPPPGVNGTDYFALCDPCDQAVRSGEPMCDSCRDRFRRFHRLGAYAPAKNPALR